MIKQYTLIAVLSFMVISGLIFVSKEIDKHNKIEWAQNRENLINECRLSADKALSDEWEANCEKYSLSKECMLPLNFYQIMYGDLQMNTSEINNMLNTGFTVLPLWGKAILILFVVKGFFR
jgi:hypothetical protein